MIGKDIVRFHAVYWPAFLMSAGIALPKRVFGHGFLNNRGEKMSKSVGNVVDPFAITAHYGVDQMRYFFMREVSFGQDGAYSHDAIVNRINADLANDLGNLAQRSLSMIGRYAAASCRSPARSRPRTGRCLPPPTASSSAAASRCAQLAIHLVLTAIWQVVADANRYFASQEPWALRKTTRGGWRPCSTSPPKSCGRWRSWCSR